MSSWNDQGAAEGLEYGMEIGGGIGSIFGPIGTLVGDIIGGGLGYWIGGYEPLPHKRSIYETSTHYKPMSSLASYSDIPISTEMYKTTKKTVIDENGDDSFSEVLGVMAAITPAVSALASDVFSNSEDKSTVNNQKDQSTKNKSTKNKSTVPSNEVMANISAHHQDPALTPPESTIQLPNTENELPAYSPSIFNITETESPQFYKDMFPYNELPIGAIY